MVDIGRCSSCGTYISEVWTKKDNCGDCGGSIDHIKEELGQLDHLPRIFNIGGIILLVIAVILFIIGSSSDGSTSLGPIILLAGSISLFILSLGFQMFMVKKAIEKRDSIQVKTRKTRTISPDRSNVLVKKGKLNDHSVKATKIITRK